MIKKRQLALQNGKLGLSCSWVGGEGVGCSEVSLYEEGGKNQPIQLQ